MSKQLPPSKKLVTKKLTMLLLHLKNQKKIRFLGDNHRKMKKLILVCILALFGNTQSFAQRHRTCATHDRYLQAVAANPTLLTRRAAMENQIQTWISNHAAERVNSPRTVQVTVPVVVHVLYQNATQNISDQQIQTQIDVLNTDYAHLNADSTLTPTVFQPLMADVQIRFCLASVDPTGSATSGIERRSITITNIGNTSIYYQYAQGGLAAWDHTKYLNFWVCDIDGGNTLGFAYLPGTTGASDDGVVIDYNFFGTIGTVAAPYDLGRTVTHEVGHWFNLEHIWGDESACAADDFVNDTPQQKAENYGCPTYPQTTQSGGRCSTSDPSSMYMNFMDYTDDGCMVMFSIGQRDRMQAALNTQRPELFTATGCNASVGIQTTALKANLLLFQNPSAGVFEFSLGALNNTSVEMNVTDITGRVVLTTQYHDGKKCSFDISEQPTGIYMMNVKAGDAKLTKKLIKL